ncbi:hypothetical protein ACFLU6_01525 [Acidobacteriota bacterium]
MKACGNVLWILILSLLLCVNCSKKMAWEDVKRINQYTVYNQFLKENPGTEYRKEIEQAIDSLKQKWHPEMREIKSMAVEFEEDLPGGTDFSKSRVQIKLALKVIMEDMCIEFIEFNKPADATIKVTIKGDPLYRNYHDPSYRSHGLRQGRHYSGARVRGDIIVIKNSQSIQKEGFFGEKQTPKSIAREYNNSSDAPFNEAVTKSNFPAAGYALFRNLLNMRPRISTRHNLARAYSDNVNNYLNRMDRNKPVRSRNSSAVLK